MSLGSYELVDHHRVNEDERGGQVYRGDVAAVGADGGVAQSLLQALLWACWSRGSGAPAGEWMARKDALGCGECARVQR